MAGGEILFLNSYNKLSFKCICIASFSLRDEILSKIVHTQSQQLSRQHPSRPLAGNSFDRDDKKNIPHISNEAGKYLSYYIDIKVLNYGQNYQ